MTKNKHKSILYVEYIGIVSKYDQSKSIQFISKL